MMKPDLSQILQLCLLLCFIKHGLAVQCYQCDSNEDQTCPADYAFDKNMNAMVDCSGFEARVPGTFCMKIYRESSGWYGWVKITRRCGSMTQTGVAWGCRWFYDDQGVFREMCYCDTDGCNSSSRYSLSAVTLTVTLLTAAMLTTLLTK